MWTTDELIATKHWLTLRFDCILHLNHVIWLLQWIDWRQHRIDCHQTLQLSRDLIATMNRLRLNIAIMTWSKCQTLQLSRNPIICNSQLSSYSDLANRQLSNYRHFVTLSFRQSIDYRQLLTFRRIHDFDKSSIIEFWRIIDFMCQSINSEMWSDASEIEIITFSMYPINR